ncbi:MAG: type II secretion system F family protein [Pseudomonadota bacterium]
MRYRIKYIDAQHKVQEHISYASSEHQALESYQQKGLMVLKCSVEETAHVSQRGFSVFIFLEELLNLLNAGLNISEALHALRRHASEYAPEMSRTAILLQLENALQKGERFSEALRNTGIFPELLIATVEASESTGGISDALKHYVELDREHRQLKESIVSGCLYPALVLAVGGAVIAFLMLYVVPRFSVIFVQMNKTLPWSTQLLIDWGLWVDQHHNAVVIALIALVISLLILLFTPQFRPYFLQLLTKLPYLNLRIIQFQRARFYRALGALLAAGISLPKAMLLSRGVLNLPLLINGVNQAQQSIQQGHALSQAFSQNHLIDSIGEQLLTAAEGRGQMPSALYNLAIWTESDLRRVTQRFMRVLEPVLMILMGVLIGVIVVMMYMPLFELTGNLL